MSMTPAKSTKKKEFNIYSRIRSLDKARSEPCYELTFLLRSDMSYEDAKSLVEKVVARITDASGRVHDSSYWGLRSLRYKIKRMRKAHFYCLHFTGTASLCADLDRFMRNNASILRFMNVRIHSLPTEKSPMIVNLEKDVADGVVVFDEKYMVSLK